MLSGHRVALLCEATWNGFTMTTLRKTPPAQVCGVLDSLSGAG